MKGTLMNTLLIILLVVNIIFCYSWCYFLEKNQKVINEQLNIYQQLNFEHNEKQDKDIRILKQDVVMLEKDGVEK